MFAYPGVGRALNLATYTSASGNVSQVTFPLNPVILSTQLSDCEPLSDSQQTTLQVNFAAFPTAATVIEISPDPTFTNVTSAITIPLSATEKDAFLTIREPINGFLRINNTSQVTISSAFVNKQVQTGF